jgi:hypothetical protein
MRVKPLQLIQAQRVHADGIVETLHFEPGVNVIVGEPNTGKSKWCRTIDYVLGDEKSVEAKLGATLTKKFIRASLTMKIGNEEFKAERRWHEAGAKGKVFVGEMGYLTPDFRQLLLDKLEIAAVHYPSGNPYGPRTWPELSFRSLLRHMYRRQKPWADIADGQYPSEQHACIVQFFGMAETLFSAEYGEMIQKEKLIAELKLKKEQFLETLYAVSKEIVDQHDITTFITQESIADATKRVMTEVNELNESRRQLLASLISETAAKSNGQSADIVSQKSKEYAELKQLERIQAADLEKVLDRISEIEELDEQVTAELSRLARAKDAGTTLADLKATHCPVCDQRIKYHVDGLSCYLCNKLMPTTSPVAGDTLYRLDFELNRLKAEKIEIGELIASLKRMSEKHNSSIRSLRSKAAQVAELLKPVRLATAAVIPPEVAELEMEVGRRVERIEQLNRIRESIDRQQLISARIDEIQKRVDELELEVNKRNSTLDFETPSDLMTHGMNEYTSKLVVHKEKIWKQLPIRFNLTKHDVRMRVGKQRWDDQLGETNTIYFLLAYHYALLASSNYEHSRYPKFLMIELPGEVEGKKVADKENFVIEPFIELCKKEGFEDLQVIATGSSFENLKGAHRIELTEVWAGAPGQAPEQEEVD